MDFQTLAKDDVEFYASFEQPGEDGTKVYANEDLLLRWNADDRVSIFNKNTYNQQYQFTGETGDNAGGFRKVDTDEFVTGKEIGERAFFSYERAHQIEIAATTPPLGAPNMFNDADDCPIYVPAGSVASYQSAPFWSEYADRIQANRNSIPDAVDLGLPSGRWLRH